MNQKISALIQKSDIQFTFFSRILNDCNQEQLAFRLFESKWSIIEICYHVYLAETLTYKFVTDFSFERKRQKLGTRASLRSLITNLILNSNFKFKAPVNALENFPDPIDSEVLLANWNFKRKEFKEHVETFDPNNLRYFVFKHPLAGKFNILQTLGFTNSHMLHHKRQIEKIMESQNFPKQS